MDKKKMSLYKHLFDVTCIIHKASIMSREKKENIKRTKQLPKNTVLMQNKENYIHVLKKNKKYLESPETKYT